MTVVNLNRHTLPFNWDKNPNYVYIGRKGKGFNGKWGNPYTLENESERANVLRLYSYWLTNKLLLGDPNFAKEVAELAEKTLVCFCTPKACHGDILQNVALVLKYLGREGDG